MVGRRTPALIIALILLVGTGAAVLAGCGQKEEADEPGYYTGKDFKGKGGNKGEEGGQSKGGKTGGD